MSTVFKKFSKSDVSITPFNAHKLSSFNSSSLIAAGGDCIQVFAPEIYSASQDSDLDFHDGDVPYRDGTYFDWAGTGSTDDPGNHKKFFQIDHLFYRNAKLDYHNKFSNISYTNDYRELYHRANIVSLPYKTVGYKVKPGSLHIIHEDKIFFLI